MATTKLMTLVQREAFFSTLQKSNPHPETELAYVSPFELLTAVLLSAQATDISVNKATRKLFLVANTPQKILNLGEAGLLPYIASIGLYRMKGKHLLQTCQLLIDLHGGRVPRDRESLEALPGVGRKTANVLLNTLFGEIAMAVDTHIFRVSNRTGLAPGKDVLIVEQQLLKRVPKLYLLHAHHWLILLGRYVCKARSPECSLCTVEPVCQSKEKNFKLR
jgi:endonuclease-3